jgi:DNA-binding LytR/AlgR family response regulator
MSESIAASSSQAGFAADEVIGFAAALASLKVRPEEARGVLVRLFRQIDLSVSSGGKSLNDFAKVVGSTSAEAANLWKQDPSQFVQSFLQGAQATGQLNQVITDLGITNTRELNVIQRLAGNMDVLRSSLADSKEQYVLGTYAQEAYGKVADDLTSKLNAVIAQLQPRTQATSDRIPVKTGGKVIFVNIPDIDWIGSADNYVELHVGPQAHLIRETMTAMEQRLPSDRFVRISRTTIINSDRVKELQPLFHGEYSVTLRDGTKLTLSRTYRDQLPRLGIL